jgi:hypothetical protein
VRSLAGTPTEALGGRFDHEMAMLQAGQRQIVKMEFAAGDRIQRAHNLGYVCQRADGAYDVASQSPDIVYGSGSFTTVFVGKKDAVHRAIELEGIERGPDPEKRLVAMRELGLLLGYPTCCTERYENQLTQDESSSFDRLLGEHASVQGHHANNLFVLEHQLISHFPCTLLCDKSAALGLQALEICRSKTPEYGQHLNMLLRAPIRVWDRFRFLIQHPTLGELCPNQLSLEERVRNHPALLAFLSHLPLLPEGGTSVYWNT